MGGGLPLIFILLVGFIVLVLLVLNGAVPLAKAQQARATKLRDPGHESLTYVVPPGQDPAAIIAALVKDGYGAVSESRDGVSLVHVETREGADRQRARVRAAIAHGAALNIEGDPMPDHEVRFADE